MGMANVLSMNGILVIIFLLGYLAITLEHLIKINKAAVALGMAIICWAIYFIAHKANLDISLNHLFKHFIDVAQIALFLIGAMTIVEIVDSHQGFKLITDRLRFKSKRVFLWATTLMTFFLSAILDNLTTTIIMVSLFKNLIPNREDRLLFGGMAVLAANIGGSWSPIGDITTTMLWMQGLISTTGVIKALLFPCLVAICAALIYPTIKYKGEFVFAEQANGHNPHNKHGTLVLGLGAGALASVPLFKALTGLPPFMGILLGVALLWIVTDLLHSDSESREHLKVPHALSRIDLSSVLFFIGILLAVGALESQGLLQKFAIQLNHIFTNQWLLTSMFGPVSAVIDNVPLVASAIHMYSIEQYPTDSIFWNLIAYCAGIGGNILIIGSAAGVVFMGLEKVDFFWYLKKITPIALFSYCAGIACYYLIS